VLSPSSTHKLYELGIESIPSESECYPAKLAHGHVKWLIEHNVDFVFYPALFYERKEVSEANDHYNCPIVTSYSENIKNNMEEIGSGQAHLRNPFLSFRDENVIAQELIKEFHEIPASEITEAVHAAWLELNAVREDIKKKGEETIAWLQENGKRGIVFSVDETGFHGKIVSMTQSRNELKWTSDKSMHQEQIGANDKSLGLNNMDVIKSCEDWRKKYPAFAWCEQLGEGWYLPALREAEKILHVELMNLLNKRLIANGGQPIAGGAAYYWTSAAYYWTSTEGGDSGAWVAYEHRYHSFGSSVEHKSVVHYVRAVSLF